MYHFATLKKVKSNFKHAFEIEYQFIAEQKSYQHQNDQSGRIPVGNPAKSCENFNANEALTNLKAL